MAVVDLYSKRQRRERGEVPDVFQYSPLPHPLRTQICYLFDDILGPLSLYKAHQNCRQTYLEIVSILRREYGVASLIAGTKDEYYRDLHGFVMSDSNVERVLDAIELAFRGARDITWLAEHDRQVDAATAELNTRFLEHGIGYQLEGGVIMRADSRLLHQKAVQPALQLLSNPDFKGAEEEFRQAFEHHRHANEKDALTWSLKALESTLKIICGKHGWPSTGQAKDLLDTVFANGLIEPMWQSEFAGLRSVLESGVPTARNKLGGHGQGGQPVTVPGYLAAFVIHQAAAAIVFLVEAHKAKP